MNMIIIGSSGHYGYALNPCAQGASIIGLAPGILGEDMTGVLHSCRQKGQHPTLFATAQDAFATLHPDIAIINSHFYLNAELAMLALSYGAAVFCEKPVALSLDELMLLEQAQKKSGKPFCAMFGIRYDPWFLAAKQVVDSGILGEIRLLHGQKSYKLGTRADFYTKRASYGGTIPWVAIHAVDWIYYMTGLDFTCVTATHSTLGNNGLGDLEATCALLLEMKNGVIATVAADYLRPAASTRHDDDRLRITGTQGTLEVRDRTVYVQTHTQPIYEVKQDEQPRTLFLDFAREVMGGPPCPVSAKDSFSMTRVALLARQAADEGKRMPIPQSI